jgi:Bacterial membrane protein YfhO
LKVRTATLGASIALGLAFATLLLARCWIDGAVPALIDLPDFFWPMKAYTAARWAAGSVPLWNPLSGCGEPWLAQLQTGVFYPGDLAFFLPWPHGPLAAILLHLVVASVGMAAWLDDLGASRPAALAGAAVFIGAGAFLSLVPVFNNFCTAAYLPWLFRGARRAARGGSVAGFAIAAALAFLAGEPGLAFGGALAAGLMGIAIRRDSPSPPRIGDRAGRALGKVAAGGLLAAGLVAVVAFPFGELLVRSGRIASATREEALARAVGPSDVVDLVLPSSREATRRAIPGRGGYLLTLSLGPLAFVLAAGSGAGLSRRPRLLAGLAGIGLLGLLLSLGGPGFLAGVLHQSGLFAGIRFPARWFVFFHFAFSVAVAAGMEGWLTRPAGADGGGPTERRARLVSGAVLVLFLASAATLLAAGIRSGRASGDTAGRAILVLAAAGFGVLLLAVYRLTGRPGPRAAGWCLFALLAAPLPWCASDPLIAAPAGDLVSRPPVVRDLASPERGRLLTLALDPRVLTAFTAARGGWTVETPRKAHAVLAGYGNLWHGLATAGSPSPIESVPRARFLQAAASSANPAALFGLADVRAIVAPFEVSIPGARLARQEGGVSRYDLPGGAGRMFFPAGARPATDDETWAALARPGFTPDAVAFVANGGGSVSGALPPARGETGYSVASLVRDLPELTEISTTSSAPGVLVVTRTYDPGWEASVDGLLAALLRVDLAFSGVVVPKGEHRVTLAYRPLSYRVGMIVSLASLVVLAGVLLAGHPPLPEDL